METFVSVMQYLREELPHVGLFVGRKHTRFDKQYIRRELKSLI